MSRMQQEHSTGLVRPNDPPMLILASLSSGAKHGYALMQDIEAFARVKLGPGSLYGAISRLEEQGLIRPLKSNGRAQPYELTVAGHAVLNTAIVEMRQLVKIVGARLARVPRVTLRGQLT